MKTPPKPSDAQKALAKLAGSWKGKQKLTPSPWDEFTGEATASLDFKSALDGMFMLCEYTQKRGEQTYKGHLVAGYSDGAKAHQVHWFDSWGSAGAPFNGKLEGDTLTVERDGAKGRMRLTWAVKGTALSMTLSSSTDDGKTWKTFSEGSLKKS